MRARASHVRAGLGAWLTCLSVAMLLSGCSVFHRHGDVAGCHERPFNGDARNFPPLKVPPGLTAPDRIAQIKMPTLDAPGPGTATAAPCLDLPPKYVNEPLQPPVRRPTQPATQPPAPPPALPPAQ